jgi:hypothetical protein
MVGLAPREKGARKKGIGPRRRKKFGGLRRRFSPVEDFLIYKLFYFNFGFENTVYFEFERDLKIHKFQDVTDLPHLDGISSSRFRVLLE